MVSLRIQHHWTWAPRGTPAWVSASSQAVLVLLSLDESASEAGVTAQLGRKRTSWWVGVKYVSAFLKCIHYFWLHWVFVATRGLSPSCDKQGLLFFAVWGLLIVVASLVAEHGL